MIPGTNNKGLEPSNPGWVDGPTKELFIVAIGGSMTKEWAAYGFSFIPDKDGTVLIKLMGPWMSPVWLGYDNLVVTGAKLENLDFESVDKSGSLDGWASTPENLVANSAGAQSGKNFVRVAYDKMVVGKLTVTKGQEVTINFQAKVAEAPAK